MHTPSSVLIVLIAIETRVFFNTFLQWKKQEFTQLVSYYTKSSVVLSRNRLWDEDSCARVSKWLQGESIRKCAEETGQERESTEVRVRSQAKSHRKTFQLDSSILSSH